MYRKRERILKYLASGVLSITLGCFPATAHTPKTSPVSACKCGAETIEYKQKLEKQQPPNATIAGSNIHGFVEFGTDYTNRGISETQRYPSVITSVLYIGGNRIYGGLIAGNVSYTKGGIALIPTIGYMKQIDKFGYQLALSYLSFPGYEGPRDISAFVYEGKVSYFINPIKASIAVAYSPSKVLGVVMDYFGNLTFNVTDRLRIEGNIGYHNTSKKPKFESFRNFYSWNGAISFDIFPSLTVKGKYSNNSLNRVDCFGQNICAATFALSIKKSF